MNTLKDSTYRVSLLSFGHFLSDFYCNFLPILLPFIMPKLGLSLTLSGVLVMVFSFTSNVLQPFFGYLIDRNNLNRLLLIVIPSGAIFICSTGYVHTTIALFFVIAISGIAVSCYHPLASNLVSAVADKKNSGLSLSLFVAAGNLGFALAPLILVYFTEIFSLSALPFLILPALVLSIFYYHSRLYTIETAGSQNKPFQIKALLKNSALVKLNLAMGLRAWTHAAVSTFLPILLISRGKDATAAGILLTIFLIGAALGGMAGGFFKDRFGYKKVISTLYCSVYCQPAYFFPQTLSHHLPCCISFYAAPAYKPLNQVLLSGHKSSCQTMAVWLLA